MNRFNNIFKGNFLGFRNYYQDLELKMNRFNNILNC